MTRPANHGLSRFRLDCNFFDDERIMAIAGEFGSTGELVALRLLTMIYRNGYRLRWDDMLRMRLMRCVDGVTVDILDRIVARLAEYGFFDADTFRRSSVLTSREIQQQYAAATRRRRTAPDHRPFWLLDTPADDDTAGRRDEPAPKRDLPTGQSLSWKEYCRLLHEKSGTTARSPETAPPRPARRPDWHSLY